MSLARPTRMLLLTILTISCGRQGVETRSPELSGGVADAAGVVGEAEVGVAGAVGTAGEAEVGVADAGLADAAGVAGDAEVAADDAVREPGAAQTISFADDADPEPTTQVQAAPKRPPIPRFRLFGTREHDGPN